MSSEDPQGQAGRGRSHSISFQGDHPTPPDCKDFKAGTSKSSILSLLGAAMNRSPPPLQTVISPSASSSSVSSDEELRTPPSASPRQVSVRLAGDETEELDGIPDLNSWRKNAAYALGRRSSWTPDNSSLATSPVSSWLKGLPSSPPPTFDNDTSNSLGLFRRLSLGASTANKRPVIKQPVKPVAESAIDDSEERLGRDLVRRPSTTKRGLSPMSAKMLTGGFYT